MGRGMLPPSRRHLLFLSPAPLSRTPVPPPRPSRRHLLFFSPPVQPPPSVPLLCPVSPALSHHLPHPPTHPLHPRLPAPSPVACACACMPSPPRLSRPASFSVAPIARHGPQPPSGPSLAPHSGRPLHPPPPLYCLLLMPHLPPHSLPLPSPAPSPVRARACCACACAPGCKQYAPLYTPPQSSGGRCWAPAPLHRTRIMTRI